MGKKSELQELNADDKRLIAEATTYSKKTVDKVLTESLDKRNNEIISESAEVLVEMKDKMKTSFKKKVSKIIQRHSCE